MSRADAPLRAGGGAPRAPKRFRAGTQRTIAPAETVARVRPLMPVLGITRVANITGLDSIGVHAVMVCRPNARSVAVSQGKGLDLDAARASGLMEALESFHAERVDHPLRLASYNDMRFTRPVIDLAGLPRIAASPFHPARRLLWIEGADLIGGGPLWLPFDLVHTCYTLPLPEGSGCFFMSSNGLASGNHALEAVSHAICEVVERDATAVWHARGAAARAAARLDLATVDDPGCLEVLWKLRRAGVAVAVWDTTSDIGIPSFHCWIVERSAHSLRPLPMGVGSGCHPCREVALLRALTEAAQTRLTQISGARDELSRLDIEQGCYADAIAAARAEACAAGPGRSLRTFQRVPTRSTGSLDEDVAWELERLRAAGIEQVALVDLTKPEIGIPVVRVVIPGLEALHDAPGYVPGPRARAARQEGAS